MKIILIGFEFPPIVGGGGAYLYNLAGELANQGVDVIVLTSGSTKIIEVLNQRLIIKRFPEINDLYYGKGDIFQVVEILINEFRQETPDILHTQSSLETLVGQVANNNFGVPHFVTQHKTPEYNDKTIVNGKWSLYNFVNQNTECHFVASSKIFKENLIKSGVNPRSVKLIYPGVSTKRFRANVLQQSVDKLRSEIGVSKNDKVILVPTVIRKRKGLEFLAKSLSQVDLIGRSIKLIITGLPNDSSQKNILDQVGNMLPSNVLIKHGHFSDEDLPILYNMADITVLPSAGEGLGMVLLEAMNCGCAVIGTKVIGINEVIKDRQNGLLVNFNKFDELSKAVLDLLNDDVLRQKCIKGGYSTVKSKFNLTKQAIKHVEYYRQELGSLIKSAGGVLYKKTDKGKVYIYLVKSEYGYVLPKGRLESGETWFETSIREIKEETGYSVNNPQFNLGVINYKVQKNGKYFNKIVKLYAYEVFDIKSRNKINPEVDENISEGKWFTFKEAVKINPHESEVKKIQELNGCLENT